MRVLALITVVTYVLAGIAKLRYGGWGWLDGDVLRNQVATDALQKTLLGAATRRSAAGWRRTGGCWCRRRWRRSRSSSAHRSRCWVDDGATAGWRRRGSSTSASPPSMAIAFPYPSSLVAFAPFYDVEVAVLAVARRRPWRRI